MEADLPLSVNRYR